MTKPLTFFLELVGAIFIFLGIIPPVEILKIILGSCMFLLGAIGIRYRLRKQ